MTDQKIVYVAVIGVGGVGKTFLKQFYTVTRDTKPSPKSLSQVRIVYIARSSKALRSEQYEPISRETWQNELDISFAAPLALDDLEDFLERAPGPAVLVDNTTSNDVAQSYPSFLSAGISVITPNKLAFAGEDSLWNAIHNTASNASGPPDNGLIFHEAVVGAGLPVVCTIKDLVRTGNPPTKIEAVLSGSLSYLFNSFMPAEYDHEVDRSVSFHGLVTQAMRLGYTEPDPRSDLSGLDVARKCTILARLCGLDVAGLESFRIQSLIPTDMKSCKSGEEFLMRLKDYDEIMDNMRLEAAREGKVLRFVATVDVPLNRCSVDLSSVDPGHPFATLTNDDLQLNVYTTHYANPVIIKGSGEGAYLAVLTDLLRVCEARG